MSASANDEALGLGMVFNPSPNYGEAPDLAARISLATELCCRIQLMRIAMRGMRLLAMAGCVVALSCLRPHIAAAQSIVGRVVLADSTTGVPGAIVVATDSAGASVRALTNAGDAFHCVSRTLVVMVCSCFVSGIVRPTCRAWS